MLDFSEAHFSQPLVPTDTELDSLLSASPLEESTSTGVQGALVPTLELTLLKEEPFLEREIQGSFEKNSSVSVGIGDDLLLGNSQILVGESNQGDTLLRNWTQGKEIVFIDAAITDAQSLISSINSGAEIVRLEAARDGIEQISEVLSQRQDISAVHIVSHGSAGSLELGSAKLNQENLEKYGDALKRWGKALTAKADILFYGCNVAEGEVGQAFVNQLSVLTGADVAASDDLTGNTAYGGNDWLLEYQSGTVEALALTGSENFTEFLGTISLENNKLLFDEGLTANNIILKLENNNLVIDDKEGSSISAGAGITDLDLNFDSVTFSLSSLTFSNFEIDSKEVTFASNLFLNGSNLKVNAESITVQGVTLSTRKIEGSNHLNDLSIGNSGSINFLGKSINIGANTRLLSQSGNPFQAGDIILNAREFGTAELENLSPINVPTKTTKIDIGTGALLQGNNIRIKAQSEDKTFAELLGISSLVNDFLIKPLVDKGIDLLSLPVKVLIKESDATVTLNENVQLIGGDRVSVEAIATSDSTGKAASELFSIGYAQADASAVVDLKTGVNVNAGGEVLIRADGSATASITTETKRELGEAPSNPNSMALSLGVANTDAISHAFVAQGATITAGKTANIVATGASETEVETEAGLYADGRAGLAFGIGLSDADIKSEVNGTVTANMNPGSVVKLEFDPTVSDPNQKGYIDFEKNTINVGANSLKTGDKVSYKNYRGRSIGGLSPQPVTEGLVDKRDYYVITVANNPNLIQLAETELNALAGVAVDLYAGASVNTKTFNPSQSVNGDKNEITLNNPAFSGEGIDFSLLGSNFGQGQAVVYKAGSGNAIGGLEDGKTYYVIPDTNEFSLQGDNRFAGEQKIKLAETYQKALAGIAIDIDPAQATGTGHTLSATHVLDPELATGVGVIATLESTDKVKVTSGLNSEEKPEPSNQTKDSGFNLNSSIFDQIFKGLTKDYQNKSNAGGSNATSALSLAGAFAFSETDNTVVAKVGSSADLNSKGNIEVVANITEKLQLNAESNTEPQEGNEQAKEKAFSTAVIVGLQDNNAEAIVSSGARLDAQKGTHIFSEVAYPYLTRPDEFIPNNLGELTDLLKTQNYDAVNNYLDGTLGLKSKLFNTWAKSNAKASNLSVAGSVNFLEFDNTSKAIIQSGALINQDPLYTSDESSVFVEATNGMQLLNVTGVFDFKLPEGSLSPTSPEFDPQFAISPVGSQSEKGGVGGAIFLMFLNNTTKSEVESGVKLSSGKKGGFKIGAEEAIMNFNFTQGGAKAGKYAISGSFAYVEQNSTTIARLDSGAIIKGPSLKIEAASKETQINWVGGVAKGNNLGFGVSIALNNINRDTFAGIGNLDSEVPGTTTNIDVEEIGIEANNDGALWAFSLAAALVSDPPKDNPTGQPDAPPAQESKVSDDPLDGVSLVNLFNEEEENNSTEPPKISNDDKQQGKSGIGISGDVSINTVNDKVRAYIYDAGTIKAESVAVTGLNQTDLIAASGSAAIVSSSDPNKKSLGIAGSFSSNTLNGTTEAFISGNQQLTLITEEDLKLKAERKGKIVSVSAGGSSAAGKNGIAIAGSVSLNEINNKTKTNIEGVNATIGGNSTIEVQDGSTIYAIGGAASLGGKAGFGASVARNEINNTIESAINDSTLIHTGDLTLSAKSNADIRALTASLGIATGQNGFAGTGTVSINLIENTVKAGIFKSNNGENSTGAIAITAEDNSTIKSLAGAVGIGQNAGIGAAIAYNDITNTLQAQVDRSTLKTTGNITLAATSNAQIDNITAGVGGGKNFGLAGSVSINLISNAVDSYIKDSTITANDIKISAKDDSEIFAIAGGVAGSSSGSAVGAAVAVNEIGDTDKAIQAYIQGGSVSATGNVQLDALGGAEIFAITAGAAGANNFSLGGSVSVNNLSINPKAYIGGGAVVNADGSIAITANSDLNLDLIAGGVGVSSGSAVGVGTTVLTTNNTVAAYVEGLNTQVNAKGNGTGVSVLNGEKDNRGTRLVETVKGLSVVATAFDDIQTIAAAGGIAGGTAGVAGAATVNSIANITQAYLSQGIGVNQNLSNANTAQSVYVFAWDDSQIISVAGSIGIAGGSAGVAGGVDVGVIDKTTQAYIAPSAKVKAENNIGVRALTSGEITSVSASLGAAGTAGVAGSVGVSVINETTKAYIGNQAIVTATGSIIVDADSRLEIDLVAGSGGFGGTAGVGISAGVPVINKVTESYIGQSAQVTALGQRDGVLVKTGEFDTQYLPIEPLQFNGTEVDINANTIRFSKAHGFSSGDAIIFNQNNSGSIAGLADQQTYYVIVIDDQTIQLTESFAASFNSAYGSPIDLSGASGSGHILQSVEASDETDLASETSRSFSSSSVNTSNDTIAFANDPGLVTGVAIAYSNRNGNAIGGLENGKTYYVIADQNNPKVIRLATSRANAEAGIAIDLTSLGTGDEHRLLLAPDGKRITTPKTQLAKGLAVTATSTNDMMNIAAAGGGAGTAGVSLGAAVYILHNQTKAYIDSNAKINANNTTAGTEQGVSVVAGTDFAHLGIAGSLAIGGTAGVGPGANVTVVDNITEAYIAESTQVNATQDVRVEAIANEDIFTLAATAAGSGAVAIAGSVDTFSLTNKTHAFLGQDSQITAGGNVLVNAEDNTVVESIAGSLGIGIGIAGVGASAGVIVIEKDTQAYINDRAIVNAAGNSNTTIGEGIKGIGVNATSSEDILTIAASGAGGFFAGVAGAVSVTNIDSDTKAFVGRNAQLNQNNQNISNSQQTINITANNQSNIFAVAGSLAGGIVGIGGGVDVGTIQNHTTAYIDDGSKVYAKKDVTVDASSEQEIDSYAVSAGGGLVGIAGSVSVYGIGAELDGQSKQAINSSNGNATDSADDLFKPSNSLMDLLGSYDSQSDLGKLRGGFGDRAKTQIQNATAGDRVSNALSREEVEGTISFIGKNVTVETGEDINVKADAQLDFNALTGQVSIGLAGIGGSVVVANIDNTVRAYVDEGSQLSAVNNIQVDAKTNEKVKGISFGGQGGVVSLGASVSVIDLERDISAYLGNNTTVLQANTLGINAATTSNIEAKALNASVGQTAVGGTDANISATGFTKAYLGDSVSINNAQSLNIQAQSKDTGIAESEASTGGILAGSGAVSQVSVTPTVEAYIGANGVINISADAVIEAKAEGKVTSEAGGLNLGGVSVGVSEAEAEWKPTVFASVGDLSKLDANNITIKALTPNITDNAVTATANPSAGSLLGSGVGAIANTTINSNVLANVGEGANLTATNNLTLTAQSYNKGDANANGDSYGLFVGAGSSTTSVQITNVTKATTEAEAKLSAGNKVSLDAQSNNNGSSNAVAGAGGAIAAGGSSVVMNLVNTTTAQLGDRAVVNPDRTPDSLVGQNRQLEIKATSTINLDTKVEQEVDGLGVSNSAKGTTSVSSFTRALVGEAAQVNVNSLTLNAAENNISISTNTDAQTLSIASDVEAESIQNAKLNTEASIAKQAKIVALDNVNVSATQDLDRISVNSNVNAYGIGPDEAISRNILNATASVNADNTVILATNSAPNINVAVTPDSSIFANTASDYDSLSADDETVESQDNRRSINNFKANVGLANAIVDLLTDEDDGNYSVGDISLREAIKNISSGGNISFAQNLSGQTITLTQGQLLINKELTIDGKNAGITISGNNATRLFAINDNQTSTVNVLLNGLTLTGGFTSAHGGAIQNLENLTLRKVTITQSTSSGDGGAIYNMNGATLSLEQTTLSNNQASQGGAIFNDGGTVNLTQSNIQNNSASNRGGGIYTLSSTVTINNSSLISNTASFGGAIATLGGQVTLSQATLSGNSASIRGGGIFQDSNTGTIDIRNSTITLNTAAIGSGVISSGTNAQVLVLSSIIAGNANNDDVSGNTFISKNYNLIGGGNAASQFALLTPDTQQDPIDAVTSGTPTTYIFLTDSLAKQFNPASGNGLPDDGVFAANADHPEVILAYGQRKDDTNAVQVLGKQNVTHTLSQTEQNNYQTLHLFTISTQGKTAIEVQLTYSDGSVASVLQTIPDWFDDSGVDPYTPDDLNVLPEGIYKLVDGLDRIETEKVSATGLQNANDAAIFGLRVNVDRNKTLQKITVVNQDQLKNQAGQIDNSNLFIFGMTGETATGAAVQLDISALFNKDAIANKFTRDRVGVNDPKLAPLAVNPAGTFTHALLPDSLAIDAGGNPDNLQLDQRDIFRVSGDRIDIGAYELQKDTVVVSTLADGDDGNYTPGNLSLREALAHSESGTIVTFSQEIANRTIALTEGELLVDRNLTLEGGDLNITIDGTGNSRVFHIGDSNPQNQLNVILNNLTITGGKVQGSGTFKEQNRTLGVGGGILNRENLTINNSTITKNQAEDAGGGIYNQDGILTINNSTLSGNTASRVVGTNFQAFIAFGRRYGTGGGLHNIGGIVTVTSSSIVNNQAGVGGGGISNASIYYDESQNLFVSADSSTLTVRNSTISGNQLVSDRVRDINFISAYSSAIGGGGIVNQGSASVSSSTITNNSSNSKAVNIESGIQSSGNLTLISSILAGNQNSKDGSGFTNGGNNLINTDPKLTPLQDNGGSVPTHGLLADSPAFDKGSNPDNLTQDIRGENRVSGSGIDIGAFESQAAKPVFTAVVDTLIDEFDADFSAGDLSLREAIAFVESGGTVTFSNNLPNGTIALSEGELKITKNLSINTGNQEITIDANDNSRIFNIDDGDRNKSIDVQINGLTLTGGRAVAPGIAGHGGAILNLENLTLQDSTITGNTAVKGGAIANGFSYTYEIETVPGQKFTAEKQGTLTLINTNIVNNQAQASDANIGELTGIITNAEVTGFLVSDGGGIANNGTLSITNSIISDNSASANGGGIANKGQLTITDSIIADNIADASGGGFASEGKLTITNSTIFNNFASVDGGGLTNKGSLTITNSSIENNIAQGSGGGILQHDTYTPMDRPYQGLNTFTITNSRISGNSAEVDGGGLHVTTEAIINPIFYSSSNLIASTITNNLAGNRGGGIFSEGVVKTNETTIDSNRANLGGGIYNSIGGVLHLKGTTVSNNIANKGGGLFDSRKSTDSYLNASFVTNSTISGNIARISGGGIFKESYGDKNYDSAKPKGLIIGNSTISNNDAILGGGVRLELFNTSFNSFQASTQVFSSIISGNVNNDDVSSEVSQAGSKGKLTLFRDGRSGIYSGNSANIIGGGDAIYSFGQYNDEYLNGTNTKVGVDAKLAPLANNGGLTLTHALLPGSPAINSGVSAPNVGIDPNQPTLVPPDSNLTTDQRGTEYSRIVASGIDIGAFEVQQMLEVSILNRTLSEGQSTQVKVSRVGGDLTQDLVVTLTGSENTILPETVTILAGQTSANFTVTAVDDRIINGTAQTATITASASNYSYFGQDTLNITDTSTPEIFLTLDKTTVKEGEAIAATLSHNFGTTPRIVFNLNLSPETADRVIAPEGGIAIFSFDNSRSQEISISGRKDGLVNPDETVTINATATVEIPETDLSNVFGINNISELDGKVSYYRQNRYVDGQFVSYLVLTFTSSTQNLKVLNVDTPTLSLDVDSKIINEKGEAKTVTVRHNIETLSEDLVINLANSTPEELTLNTQTVTIAANNPSRSTTFTINPVDDNSFEFVQAANLSATAAGFSTGTLGIDIISDEFEVTNTNNSGSGSLRDAINLANLLPDTNTISFAPNLIGQTITLTNGELKITENVIFNGSALGQISIIGNNNSRVFVVDDGDSNNQIEVTINNLTIAQGKNEGIYLNREKLIVRNSNISGNFGDGIENFGGILTIENSAIANNTGAGINNSGDLFAGIFGTLNVSGSTIANNTGAGITNLSNDVVVIEGSTISDNQGAGITVSSVRDKVGTLTITNSAIARNKSHGIYFAGDKAIIRNSTISGNVSNGIRQRGNQLEVADSNIKENNGIGIDSVNSQVSVVNSTISSNSNHGIYNYSNTGSEFTLSNSTVSNSANRGIYNKKGTLNISRSTITNNSGGGINNLGTLTITESTLAYNTASFGGGIYNSNRNGAGIVTITNSTISSNTATGDRFSSASGGGIQNYGGTVNIKNSTITANKASLGSGVHSPNNAVQVTSSIISGNINGNDVVGQFNSGGYNLIGRGGSIPDNTQNSIDFSNFALITDAAAKQLNPSDGNGLPDNGFFAAVPGVRPEVQLAYGINKGGNNARTVPGFDIYQSFQFAVERKQYGEIHLFALSTNGDTTMQVEFTYTDGTTTTTSSVVPDWFNNPNSPNSYTLIDNLDRSSISGSSLDNSNNPAIFGFRFTLDSSKTLDKIKVIPAGSPTGAVTRLVFFGATGVTQGNQTVQIDVNSILNADVIVDLLGFNATGDRIGIIDPKLTPLQDNGGSTFTHAPLLDSPAIDAGSNPNGLSTDQTGANRVSGAGIDIGAVEFVNNASPNLELGNVLTVIPEITNLGSAVKVADVIVTDDNAGTNILTLTGVDADLFELRQNALYLKAGTILNARTKPQLEVNVVVNDPRIGTTFEDTASLIISVTADTLEVDTLVDENDGDFSIGDLSLREALQLLGDRGTINFAPTLADQTLTLSQGELILNKNLTINGNGIVLNGNNSNRIFNINDGQSSAANIILQGLTLTRGFSSENAGAIFNLENLTIINSTLYNNTAIGGGAIATNNGTVTLSQVTLSGNTASTQGGAILISGGTLNIGNSTITNNSAVTGSGIISSNAQVKVASSIIAGNANNTDVVGSNFISQGYNLIGGGDAVTKFGGIDKSQDSIDNNNFAFLTETAAKALSVNGNGLPDDAFFAANGDRPEVQLAYNRQDNNARIASQGESFNFSIPQDNYNRIDLFFIATEGDANTQVEFIYTDGTKAIFNRNVPDWFNDNLPADTYYLINNLDRAKKDGTGFENSNNPAIFGLRFNLDATKQVQSISVTNTDNNGSYLVFFGGTGSSNTTVQFDVTSVLNKDVIINSLFDKTGINDPKLTPLQNNGSGMLTHALLPNSPAIDAGSNWSQLSTDARGLTRTQGSGTDIGAVEMQPIALDLDSTTNGVNFSNNFVEDKGAIAIASNPVVTNLYGNNAIATIRVTLVNPFDGTTEGLSLSGTFGSIQTVQLSNVSEIFLSGLNATKAEVESLLKAITYNNNSNTPDNRDRSVQISISDGIFTSPVAVTTIAIAPVNDAPTIANATVSLNENSPVGTIVTEVTASDPESGLTYALTSGNSDLDNDGIAAFTIDSTTGKILVSDADDLDFETIASFTLGVTSTDAQGLSANATVTVNLTNINESPTLTLENILTSIPENTIMLTPLKVADLKITDDALGTNALILTGADADKFEIVASALFLKAGTILDYETQNQLQVTVAIDDPALGNAAESAQTLTIAIADITEFLEVNLKQGLTNLLTGAVQNFGSVGVNSGSNEYTFTLENTGNAPLNISGITISGLHASDFSFVGNAPIGQIAAGVNVTFTIRFKPMGSGDRSGILTLISNDSDESTYTLTLTGTATNTTTITGTDGSETIKGQGGDNTIDAGKGNDQVDGGSGSEYIKAGSGNDQSYGNDGNDRIYGDEGDDTLYGGIGNDFLRGGDDRDRLFGDGGSDYLIGDAGNDYLNGGAGNDTLRGDTGSDTFVLSANQGLDTIYDFNVNEDKFELNGLGVNQLSFENKNSYGLIKVGSQIIAQVRNITAAQLLDYFQNKYQQP